MSIRLGVLGGSFNPIHFGHLIAARAVAEQLGLPTVLLIPAAIPPHKQLAQLASGPHRLAMARLAVEGDPLFEVSDMELSRAGPSYTFDTLNALKSQYGQDSQLLWIIGADTLPELETWYRVVDLVRLAEIITVVRPGTLPQRREQLASLEAKIGVSELDRILRNRLGTPAIDISATDMRHRIAGGLSVRYLTPDAVAHYLAANGLYRRI